MPRAREICGFSALLIALASACDCGDRISPVRYRLRSRVPPPGKHFDDALMQSLGVEMRPGNRVTFANDERVFDAIVGDVSRARSSVHILSYIWKEGEASDRVLAAVTQRAKKGVGCKIIVDAFGSLSFEEDGIGAALRTAGCEVCEFRPPATSDIARNHRKLVVVDGKSAITGGFGIRDDWLKEVDGDPRWRDTNVRVEGPVVADVQRAFAENWLECGGSLLPDEAFPELRAVGPSRAAFVASTASPVSTRAEKLTQLVIASARKRIWIENAYFVPSEAISELLTTKARAGVDVRILAPGKKSDSTPSFILQQNEYGDLMKHGVRVFEYAPTMMHSKTMLVDDRLSVIGSINLEPLSLTSLEEGALVVDDPATASELEAQFVADVKKSKELSDD